MRIAWLFISQKIRSLNYCDRAQSKFPSILKLSFTGAYLLQKEHLMVDAQNHNTIIGADGEFRPSSGIGNNRSFNMNRWSDQLQHDFLDTFANGGAMTYREVIKLWSGFSGSVYINTRRIRCNPANSSGLDDGGPNSLSSSSNDTYSPKHPLYTRPGIVMARSPHTSGRVRHTQCDFVEYIGEEHTKPVDVLWPPILHKQGPEDYLFNYWEDT